MSAVAGLEALPVDSPLLDPSKVPVHRRFRTVLFQVVGSILVCWLIGFILAILMICVGGLPEKDVKSMILASFGLSTGLFFIIGVPGLFYRELRYEGSMIHLRRKLYIETTGRELPPIIRNWNSWLINVCASGNDKVTMLTGTGGVFYGDDRPLPLFTLVPASSVVQTRPVWVKVASHSPPFYYNRITKDRQWECPPDFDGATTDDVSTNTDVDINTELPVSPEKPIAAEELVL